MLIILFSIPSVHKLATTLLATAIKTTSLQFAQHTFFLTANLDPAGPFPGLYHHSHYLQALEIISRNSVSFTTFLTEIQTLALIQALYSSLLAHLVLIFPLDHIHSTPFS